MAQFRRGAPRYTFTAVPPRRRVLTFTAVAVIAIVVAVVLDRWAYDHVVWARIYETDGGRMLRILGFWPTWAIVALGVWLQERGAVANAGRRALLVAGSPALTGILCELMKLVLRRERPEAHAGDYIFRAFSERPFSTGGLALPSSHTMVAFGAAMALSSLFPRAKWLWFALAAGCALSRVLARAHFLSDVVVGAAAAIAAAAWLERKIARA